MTISAATARAISALRNSSTYFICALSSPRAHRVLCPAEGDPAVHQERVSDAHGRHQFHRDLRPLAGGVLAQRVIAVERNHPHGDAGVGTNDTAVVIDGAGAERRLVLFMVQRNPPLETHRWSGGRKADAEGTCCLSSA